MVTNDDGTDGPKHRSVIGLVKQLQAEAAAKDDQDRLMNTSLG